MKQFLAFLLATIGTLAIGAEPHVTRTELFHREQGGFTTYRIPGIVITSKGTVLAYAEARKSERSDWGEERIMLRRSTDRGKTWSPAVVIGEQPGPFPKNPAAIAKKLGVDEGTTYSNAVAIPDKNAGVVHFVYCIEYARAFYMRSDDDGVTFSKPREITAAFDAFRPEYDWKVLATGPGHGIRLKSGRLVIPIWLSLGTGGGAHRPSVTSTIYSDDRGATWHRGEIAVPDTPEWIFPNETAAAQLDDGRVMLNVRSESKAQRRLITYSADGATHWSHPEFDQQLIEPICFASIAKLPGKRLLFVNPDNLARGRWQRGPGHQSRPEEPDAATQQRRWQDVECEKSTGVRSRSLRRSGRLQRRAHPLLL